MKASVIVLSWNGMPYLGDCLGAVLAQDYPDCEVIVVDNGSSDGSADFVEERYPDVLLIRNERNLGFAAGNNIGLRAATGDVLILLNQDVVVHSGWLKALANALQDRTVGMVGCKLLYPDGTIQHAGGRIVDARGSARHIGRGETDSGQYDTMREVDFVTGAALALSRETLTRIGPLDEGFTPAYYEDTDWSYRARDAGLRVVYCPDAVGTHHESTSSPVGTYAHHAVFHYGRLRFLLKHHSIAWLESQFAPAEVTGIRKMSRSDELMAMRAACMRLLFDLSEVVRFRTKRENTRDGWESLLSLVNRLREACAQSEIDDSLGKRVNQVEERAVGTQVLHTARHPRESSPPVDKMEESRGSQPALQNLEAAWERLHKDWEIREPKPSSRLPGGAALRRLWNDAALQPYQLPVIQQQTRYNRAVTELIAALSAADTKLGTRQAQFEVKVNEIAVTQVEILHLLRILLARVMDNERDVAQSIREINTLADTLIRRQKASKTDDSTNPDR